jgi:16S rRNA pseudouridine516 synthase
MTNACGGFIILAMRLDRCLANSGYGSRTEVKEIIRKGLVSINGEVVRDAGLAVSINQPG